MPDASARFGLPFIVPGQAQKEVFHNEALNLVDCALHPCIEAGPVDDSPPAPPEEHAWLIGSAPTGDWGGKANMLASWGDGCWRFTAPVPDMFVWHKTHGYWLHWTGAQWSEGELVASRIVIGGQQIIGTRLPGLTSPSGGTVIDAEARAAVTSVIATLKSHGLID